MIFHTFCLAVLVMVVPQVPGIAAWLEGQIYLDRSQIGLEFNMTSKHLVDRARRNGGLFLLTTCVGLWVSAACSSETSESAPPVVVTPNAFHHPAAKAFLSRGIHVVCDKPLVFEVKEAEELRALARAKDLLFCVTYTYTGYPAVKHAREMIRRGDIGPIRFVNAEYPQEWLTTPLEKDGQKQAAWRADPALTGKSNCVGDIGSHVENMVRYTTGLEITRLCARLDTFVAGRQLDDNASILVEYQGGAKGLYWSSQIAVGYDNGLRIRIFGATGSIQWSQENPNYLTVSRLGQPTEVLSRGRDAFAPHAQSYSRLPSGHPEGYFEAFANLYRTFTAALARRKAGATLGEKDLDFPGVEDGISGVRFIGKCVESSQQGAVWVDL